MKSKIKYQRKTCVDQEKSCGKSQITDIACYAVNSQGNVYSQQVKEL